ncbi:MAG: CpXC domain-containing protein [Bacillota bacterium]|nr:CpXC domain-containing protein [Bacillota bacterium]
MTRFHKETVTCPFCASDEEVVIWDVMDVSEDPDLKERLLTKRCQVLECQNCGEESILARPLVYLDPAAGLLLAWRPELAEFEATEPDTPFDGRPESLLNLPAGLDAALLPQLDSLAEMSCEARHWRLRLLASYNDLLEKIHAFGAGLDDRILEIVKLALATRYADEEDLFFEAMHLLAAQGGLLLLQVLERERGWQTLEISMELYDNAYDFLIERMPAEGQWQRIDGRFARRFVTGAG